MACFHPAKAWWKVGGGITFNRRLAYSDRGELSVPCGQCIGCRLSKARDWETRLYHEGQQHERSSFVTLTFSDEHLPPDMSVSVRDLQLFMKRLRKRNPGVRFFACGEYGDANFRPHYHLILFGKEFSDQTPWRKTGSGHVVYRSAELEALWPFGHAEVGTVTPQSCGYVARYCIKKVNGEKAKSYYRRIHPETGEIIDVRPEFIVMSRRPGIGGAWFDKHSRDAFPSDFVVVDGKKRAVPAYYTKKLDDLSSAVIKGARKRNAAKHADNNTPARLEVREEVVQRRIERLKRDLENET